MSAKAAANAEECGHDSKVYICKECRTLVCFNCMNQHRKMGHSVHHNDEIRDAAKTKADLTMAELRALQCRLNEFKKRIQPLEEESKREYIQIFKLGLKLNEFIATVLSKAREARNNIPKTISKLTAECDENIKQLDQAVQHIQNVKGQIEPTLAEKKIPEAVGFEAHFQSVSSEKQSEFRRLSDVFEAQLSVSRSIVDFIHQTWARAEAELADLNAKLQAPLSTATPTCTSDCPKKADEIAYDNVVCKCSAKTKKIGLPVYLDCQHHLLCQKCLGKYAAFLLPVEMPQPRQTIRLQQLR
jgi:hypothetical protein